MKQTIVITGASSGIGKAAAKLFAERGWNVAATMRNPEKELELQMFPNVKVYALDVTNTESVQHAFKQILIDFKQIDALLNNAGYGLAGPLETASEKKIRISLIRIYLALSEQSKLYFLVFVKLGMVPLLILHQSAV